MAKRVEECIYGVDVAKDWLDICAAEDGEVTRIDNNTTEIGRWLRELKGPARVAVEATNCFHERVVALAHEAGHAVYLVDALRLSRYREAVGQRAKTDRRDAALLARYLRQEGSELRQWQPRDPGVETVWRLLKRRATVVRGKTRLRQSLTDLGLLQADVQALINSHQQLILRLERELFRRVRELGWQDELVRSRSIPGVGPLTALGLVAAFHRGPFRSADAFVAFLGMDVRVRDSGRFRGRRKLTKKGEPELRRLLYNAAMAARRDDHWSPYYDSLRARGLSGIAALVALARKLIRVCFALLTNQAMFDRQHQRQTCATT